MGLLKAPKGNEDVIAAETLDDVRDALNDRLKNLRSLAGGQGLGYEAVVLAIREQTLVLQDLLERR